MLGAALLFALERVWSAFLMLIAMVLLAEKFITVLGKICPVPTQDLQAVRAQIAQGLQFA